MTDEAEWLAARAEGGTLRERIATAIWNSRGYTYETWQQHPSRWSAQLADADAVLALLPAPHPEGGTEALRADIEALCVESDTNSWTASHEESRANVARWTACTSTTLLRALLAAAPAPTCSGCGGTGLVDWCPGQQRNSDDDQQPCPDCVNVRPNPAPAPTEAPRVGSEWDGPLLACPEPGRDGFWSYQECPRGVTGMAAHRRLGLVHRLRAGDRRHACEDVIHPAISTSHHRSVAVEDTTADLAPPRNTP